MKNCTQSAPRWIASSTGASWSRWMPIVAMGWTVAAAYDPLTVALRSALCCGGCTGTCAWLGPISPQIDERSTCMHRVVHRRALAVATLAALLVGLLVVALPGMASATGTPATFIAVMQGGNEVPGPGDPDAFGVAFVRFDGTQTCFTLTWHNLDAPTRAHIHQGARGVVGPIFEAPGGLPSTLDSVDGCTAGVDQALVRAIQTGPSGFYVNLHNAEFPGGAIRGQLHR